ncbi:hypothetical protein QJS63_05790 [Pseudomonas juntendi]|nr:hypothetical protein QJS63_05790 [Pseudomonas juntendi]
MQQRKLGATIFHLQVAPARAFSDEADFLPLLERRGRFRDLTAPKTTPRPVRKSLSDELHLFLEKFGLHLVAPELSYS